MKRRASRPDPKPRHPIMPWLEDGLALIVLIAIIILFLHVGPAIEAAILEGRRQ